jgi:hypothetical protein
VLIGSCHPSSGTQGAIEKEQQSRVPNITPAYDVHVCNVIEFLQRLHPEWVGANQADIILSTQKKTIRNIWCGIGYDIGYDIG